MQGSESPARLSQMWAGRSQIKLAVFQRMLRMESWASLSNSWRSAAEYSQVSGEIRMRDCSDDGNIVALPAPAQHERTPLAALYRMAVDRSPESDEVIDGGYQ